MDLAHEVWRNEITLRRLAALLRGLPDNASVWREDSFSRIEERLCQQLEWQDAWLRAIFDVIARKERISVPGELHLPRPGEKPPEVQKVETDVNAMAAFFAMPTGAG